MSKTKSVLVVEDDPYLVNFYERIQEELNGKVEITILDNAPEGIRALGQNTYDTLILDLVMPETDGYAVLRFIQEEDRKGQMHIAVLTNLDTEEDRTKTKELGADSYYVKSDLSNRVLQSILLGEN